MSVEERVQKIVCEQLGVSQEEVKLEASFIDDLGADSLDTVELVMAFEEEFEIEIPDEEWMDVLNVNLSGTFKISKTVLKFMLKKRWGRIINITSTSASTGNKGQANYAAAKSGVEAFSRSLAKEVGSRGITVNSVAPGYIETDMTEQINNKLKEEILKQIPLSRYGKSEEVAQLIEFLITDEASYITGQTIHINGGLYM